jgi:hypothetical protein
VITRRMRENNVLVNNRVGRRGRKGRWCLKQTRRKGSGPVIQIRESEEAHSSRHASEWVT